MTRKANGSERTSEVQVRGAPGPDATSEVLKQVRRNVVVFGTRMLMRDGIGTNEPISLIGMKPSSDVIHEQTNLLDPWWVGSRSVNTLQEWQGTVETISKTHFRARLEDLTAPGGVEFTRIPLDDLDEAYAERIEIGSVFHLIIGLCRGEDGTMRRESVIYLRHNIGSNDRPGSELASILDEVAKAQKTTEDA